MNAARIRSVSLEKLTELRYVILEHIIKVSVLPKHEAARHWQIEINSYQKKLCRYHKGKGGKANYTKNLLWEYIWEDQVDELPLGFVEEYGLKGIKINFEDIKARITLFINGIIQTK